MDLLPNTAPEITAAESNPSVSDAPVSDKPQTGGVASVSADSVKDAAGLPRSADLNPLLSKPDGTPPRYTDVSPIDETAQDVQAHKDAASNALKEELRIISGLDPDIRSLADLAASPNAARFTELVKKGYAIPDAYTLANFDKLSAKREAAARQSVLNSISGRDHLRRTAPHGEGEVRIPRETLEIYREFFPGIGDAEFRAHYARLHGN